MSPAADTRRKALARRALAQLGEVLVERKRITRAQLKRALAEQEREAQEGHWVKLGELLESWGLATPDELDSALWEQVHDNEPLLFPRESHPSVHSFIKRGLDLAGAVVGLGVTASALPWVALAIKLEDGGPVFFQQPRVGRHGYQFTMWKFRTMVPDAERLKLSVASRESVFFKPTKGDPRITRVGKVLRKTLIDELPQFWNVLRGEMSLVGTRPPTVDEVARYSPRHWQRLDVKPGMTGLWQTQGQRHEVRFEDVVTLDLDYQRQWSHALDAQILVKTLAAVTRKLSKRAQST